MKDSSTVKKNFLLFSADFAAHALFNTSREISGSDMRIKKKIYVFERGTTSTIAIIMLLSRQIRKAKEKPFDYNFLPFNFQYEY